VEIRDANDQLVSTATNRVTLALSNNPSEAELGGDYSKNAVNGVADFTGNGLYLSVAGDMFTLQASSPGLPSVTSDAFTIVPHHSYPEAGLTFSGGSYTINAWFEDSVTRAVLTNTTACSISGTSGLGSCNCASNVCSASWSPASDFGSYLVSITITNNGTGFTRNFTFNPASVGGIYSLNSDQKCAELGRGGSDQECVDQRIRDHL
jgi:hypothetical protein